VIASTDTFIIKKVINVRKKYVLKNYNFARIAMGRIYVQNVKKTQFMTLKRILVFVNMDTSTTM